MFCVLFTNESGHHLKADHWIILEELYKRKGDQGKVLHLSKDGCPVSQGRQNSVKGDKGKKFNLNRFEIKIMSKKL